jgi:hypothetical protein
MHRWWSARAPYRALRRVTFPPRRAIRFPARDYPPLLRRAVCSHRSPTTAPTNTVTSPGHSGSTRGRASQYPIAASAKLAASAAKKRIEPTSPTMANNATSRCFNMRPNV